MIRYPACMDEILQANRDILEARRAEASAMAAREAAECRAHEEGLSKAAVMRLSSTILLRLSDEGYTDDELAKLGASEWSIRQRLDRPRLQRA